MQRRTLFLSACAGILTFGFVLAILGTLFGMAGMRERLHIDLAGQGTLFLLLYLGIFLASLIAGPAADHAGNKPVLTISAALVAASMIAFTAAHNMSSAGVAAVLLGLGGGGLNTCTNALVSDLYPEERGRMLNFLGIFFGIGALFVPLLAAGIEGRFSPNEPLIACALVSVLCAIAYAVLSFPPPAAVLQKSSPLSGFSVFRNAGVWLIAILLFCESGNEACIAGWTSTYANISGFSTRTATLLLAGYWATLMLSRLFAGGLLRKISKAPLVLTCAFVAVAGAAILMSSHSLLWLSVGVALIGFSYGPIFPTTLAIAGDRHSSMAGTVFGFLFSVALLGGMWFPWLVGQVSQRAGVSSGLSIPLAGAVGIVCLSGVLMRQSRTGAQRANSSVA